MSETPFIKFFPGDFLGGTSGLTAAERGAYITILCLIWEMDGPVPLDEARLARRCGMPKAAFKRVLEALIAEGKLILTPAGLMNDRAEKTLTDRQNRTQNATHAANQRWGKQGDKIEEKQSSNYADAMREQCVPDAKPEARSQIDGDDALARVPEREPPGVLTFRERILEAMGLDPATGITGPSCRVVGTQADMAEASRWLEMPGMTEDAIVAEVQRISAGRSPPNTFRYFTRAMQELSGALSAPAVVPVRPQNGGFPQQTGRPAYDPRDQRRIEAEERERRIVDAAVHGTAKGFG